MPTENRSNTEMVSELLPCPFCKAAMRIESNRDWHRVMGDHDEECVFLDPETMTVPATDEQRELLVRDWNRRKQPAEPHQGEPVAYARICGVGRDSKGNTVSMEIGVDSMPVPRKVELGEQLIFVNDHRREVERLRESLACALKSAENVNAEAVALRIQLSEHQWHYEPYDDHYHRDAGHYCPSCGGEQDSGHKSGCDIAKALSASAGQEKEA